MLKNGDPQYGEASVNRGNALDGIGRYNEAIESFDKGLKKCRTMIIP